MLAAVRLGRIRASLRGAWILRVAQDDNFSQFPVFELAAVVGAIFAEPYLANRG
jgi:hypothetical protein